MDIGYVDLELAGAASSIEDLRKQFGSRLPPDTELVKAGKSAAFRVQVPILDMFSEFDKQIDGARLALKAAYRLSFMWQILGGA
jgi:hypothetical protein